MSSEGARERPRLNLKPRDEAAAAKAAEERSKAPKANPFGQAKPRESILANRTGKREEDILKEEVSKEKFRLRLTPEQNEQRQAAEAEVQELEEAVSLEEDTAKKETVTAELTKKRSELDEMLATFEKLAVERAKSGEGVRPSERRRLAEEREREEGGPGSGGGFSGAQPAARGPYGGDQNYGPSAVSSSFAARNERKGTYNSGSGNYSNSGRSSSGSGYKAASDVLGKGGFDEPLAQDYERTLPRGGGAGAHDIFATSSDAASQGSNFRRGQDRF